MKIAEITYSPLIVNEVAKIGGEKIYQIGKKILLKYKNGSTVKLKRRGRLDIWMDASLFVEVPLDFTPYIGDCYNEGDEIREVTMIDSDNFLPVKRKFKKLKEGEL